MLLSDAWLLISDYTAIKQTELNYSHRYLCAGRVCDTYIQHTWVGNMLTVQLPMRVELDKSIAKMCSLMYSDAKSTSHRLGRCSMLHRIEKGYLMGYKRKVHN